MSAPSTLPFVGLKAQYSRLKPRIEARLATVLDHGQYIMGPEIKELEAALGRFAGGAACIAVSSGTTALQMALMVEVVGPGDAVFVPSFTFPATAEVILAVGAAPVFVDVDPGTFNIDPKALENAIAVVAKVGRLRMRAVLVVDLFGQPADYHRINLVAAAHDLAVIADSAQSLGARLDGVPVGRLAPLTATSFFPAKPLGCYGDGGAIFTQDDRRADVLRSIRVHGTGVEKYDIVRLGLNGRLDTIQAAILLAKLEVFAEEIVAREQVARLYDATLGPTVGIPARLPGTHNVWAQYALLIDDRDRVRRDLAMSGIPTQVYYPRPLHLQPAYAAFGAGPGSLPVSESLCRRVLCLPMHPYLDDATVRRIADAVRAAL